MKNICNSFVIAIILLLISCNNQSQQITGVASAEFFRQYGTLLQDSSIIIIDGRTEQMFAQGYIEGAINIDAGNENLVEL